MMSTTWRPSLCLLLSYTAHCLAQDFGTMGTDMGRGSSDLQNEEDLSEVLDVNMLIDGEHMEEGGSQLVIGPDGRLRRLSPSSSSMASLRTQTLLALQELGVVVGVAILVAAIFLIMIAVEKIIDSIVLRYRVRFGKPINDMEAEDPAALVGTFRLCKNTK